MQKFIYKTPLPPKKKRIFEVEFNVIWSIIHVGNEKLNLTENPKDKSRKKALYGFLRTFRAGSGSFKQHWPSLHFHGDYLECLPKPADFFSKDSRLKKSNV